MTMCRHCGRKRGHTPGCTRQAAPRARKPRPRAPTLEDAHDWFQRFGGDRTVISENGARYFALLLGMLADKE